MALTEIPSELSSTPSIVDNGNATAITIDASENATFAGTATMGGVEVSNTDDIRIRLLNGATFKAGIQVATTAGDMIAGSAVDDLTIRAQTNMLFATGGNTERLRISSAGAVELTGPGGAGETFLNFTADSNTTKAQISAAKAGASGGRLVFSTNNSSGTLTEAFRVDQSSNLLVGKTTTAFGTVGIRLEGPNGKIESTRNNNVVMALNRLSTDGSILEFYKDGTTVGSIGALVGSLMIGGGDVGIGFYQGADALVPSNGVTATRDNAIDLGMSGARFRHLYLSGGAYLGGVAAANKLDSYEEGTWTPTFHAYTGNLPSTFSTTNSGQYTKVGRMVSLIGYLQINSISGASSNIINIRGLPFPALVGDSYHPSGSITVSNMNFARTTHSAITTFNTNDLGFLTSVGNASWTWELFTIFKTSSYMRFEITYYTSS